MTWSLNCGSLPDCHDAAVLGEADDSIEPLAISAIARSAGSALVMVGDASS